jgi:hypothetical protein
MEEAKEEDVIFLKFLTKLKEKVCCTRFLFLHLNERFLPKQTDDRPAPPKTVNVIPLLDPSLRVVQVVRSGCQSVAIEARL